MITTTASAVPHIKQGRARGLCAAGGALTAALTWIVEVPLLGVHLNVRFGAGHVQTISIGQVIGVTVAASLFGWLVLALLERRTPRARLRWTTIALAARAASLALPLAFATTTSAVTGLIVQHATVGAAVIPALARPARARSPHQGWRARVGSEARGGRGGPRAVVLGSALRGRDPVAGPGLWRGVRAGFEAEAGQPAVQEGGQGPGVPAEGVHD